MTIASSHCEPSDVRVDVDGRDLANELRNDLAEVRRLLSANA